MPFVQPLRAALQGSVHHVATKPNHGGYIENYHQSTERNGDADRAHPASPFQFALLAILQLLPSPHLRKP
jgi:hypothetical protein